MLRMCCPGGLEDGKKTPETLPEGIFFCLPGAGDMKKKNIFFHYLFIPSAFLSLSQISFASLLTSLLDEGCLGKV